MRFTQRGLQIMFSRNADLMEGKAMSRNSFMKVVENILQQSIWKTSNLPGIRLSIKDVIAYTAAFSGLPIDDLIIKRQTIYLEPRMYMAVYLRRSGYSLSAIGSAFGGKHHASIMHYEQAFKDLMETDTDFSKRYVDLEFFLNSKKIKPSQINIETAEKFSSKIKSVK